MAKYQIVFKGDDGYWYTEKLDSRRASDKGDTRKQAEDRAEEILRNDGGGMVVSMGEDGDVSTWPVPSPWEK